VGRFAVIHPDNDGAAGGLVGNTHDGAEWDKAMGGGHAHRVEVLAAGGDIRGALPMIPGSFADLQHPLGGGQRLDGGRSLKGYRPGIGGQGAREGMSDQSCLYEHV
jgi:hypothetical protein